MIDNPKKHFKNISSLFYSLQKQRLFSFFFVFSLLTAFGGVQAQDDLDSMLQKLSSSSWETRCEALWELRLYFDLENESQLQEAQEKAKDFFPALFQTLEDPRPEVLYDALFLLSSLEVKPEEVVSALPPLLNHPSEYVRYQALLLLTNPKFSQFAAPLLPILSKYLEDSNPYIRFWTIILLREIEGPIDCKALLPLLKDPVSRIQDETIQTLILLLKKDTKKLEDISVVLESKETHLRLGGLKILKGAGKKASGAIPKVLPLLADPEIGIQEEAAKALKQLEPLQKESLEEMLLFLKKIRKRDLVEQLITRSIQMIGELKSEGKEAVPLLMEFLDHNSESIRIASSETLGKIGKNATPAIPKLISLLASENNYNLTRSVRISLRSIGDPTKKELPALKELLKSRNTQVLQSALQEFEKIVEDTPDSIAILLSVYQDPEVSTGNAQRALRVLARTTEDGDKIIPSILETLQKDSRRFSYDFLLALPRLKASPENKLSFLLLALDNQRYHYSRNEVLRQIDRILSKKEEILPFLLEKLKDPKNEMQRGAIEVLGKLGKDATSAVAPLIQLFQNPELKKLNNRQLLIQTLGKIGGKEAFQTLLSALQNENERIAEAARKALSTMKEECLEEVESFHKLLQNAKPNTTVHALWLLGKIRSEQSIPLLISFLENSNKEICSAAQESLALMPNALPKHLDLILPLLQSKSPQTRIQGTRLIRRFKEKAIPAVNYLLKNLQEPEEAALKESLTALEKIIPYHPKSVHILLETFPKVPFEVQLKFLKIFGTLGSDSEKIIPQLIQLDQKQPNPSAQALFQSQLAESLGNIKSEKAIPYLLELCKNASEDTQYEALISLGLIGKFPKEAIHVLFPLLDSKQYRLRSAARRALFQLPALTKEEKKFVSQFLKSPKKSVREDTLHVLGKSNSIDFLPEIISSLEDKDWQVRTKAVESIALLAPQAKSAIPALLKALRDPKPSLRMDAKNTLGKLVPYFPESEPLLLQELKSENPSVRHHMTWVVGKVRPVSSSVIKALIARLDDSENSVQLGARSILSMIAPKNPDSIRFIENALDSPKELLKKNAIYVLGKLEFEAFPAIPKLLQILEGASPFIQNETERTLKNLGTLFPKRRPTPHIEALIPALHKALENPNSLVRSKAIWLIGQLGYQAKEFAPKVLFYINKPPIEACTLAIWAIGEIREPTPGILEALEKSLKSPTQGIRIESIKTIGKLGPSMSKFLPTLLRILEKDLDEKIREAVVKNVLRLNPKTADILKPFSQALLEDKSYQVRRGVATAFRTLKVVEALPALEKGKKDIHYSVRRECEKTIDVLKRIQKQAKKPK